ncbi:MAG: hypothetical protein ABL879_04090 [Devosia sp.]
MPACEYGGMDGTKTTLERAFELAGTGDCHDVSELKLRLKREGYAVDQLSGRTLMKQLKLIIQGVREGQGPG